MPVSLTVFFASRIDIALDMGDEIPPLLMGEIADVLAATNIMYKIEVVDCYFATEEMKESIKREGIVWKSYADRIHEKIMSGEADSK